MGIYRSYTKLSKVMQHSPRFWWAGQPSYRFPNHMTFCAVFLHRRDNGDSCINQTWHFRCRWKLFLSEMPLMYRRPKRECAWNLPVRHICTGLMYMEVTQSNGIHAEIMWWSANSWLLIGKNNFYGRHSKHFLNEITQNSPTGSLNWRGWIIQYFELEIYLWWRD